MSDAAHIRSTRWEPQLDAEKIHELGGRILRLLHCQKILHGFHFQATLFKFRMPLKSIDYCNLLDYCYCIVLWNVCQKGSNGGCIVPGLISLKFFRPYLPLDMEAMPDPGFLALHVPRELLKSDHQIIRSRWSSEPPRGFHQSTWFWSQWDAGWMGLFGPAKKPFLTVGKTITILYYFCRGPLLTFMICWYSVLAGQKLYFLDGSHLKTGTSSFCPWSSCDFQNHQLSIHCWCQGAWKHPKVIFLRVDRGEMSCIEVSRCEVSTKAWQLLVSIAGSDQKKVRIRWIWWMIHDDSCSVDQGCLKFGLLERWRLCCMFVSTRYVWGFVDLENWITILSMRFRYYHHVEAFFALDFHDQLVGFHEKPRLRLAWSNFKQ